jgi:uncharacterized protein
MDGAYSSEVMERLNATLGLLVLVAAAGCGGATGSQPVVTGEAAPGIRVVGRGTATAAPDEAVFRVGVEVRRVSVAEARAAAAGAQQAVLDALRGAGIEPRDLRTVHLAVSPQYDHGPAGRQLRGYVVTNVVEARVRDLSQVEGAIDAALRAGGDEARLEGLRFEVSDPAELRARARAEAIDDARARAQQIADSLGVSLGEPLAVDEMSPDAPPRPMVAREAAMADATPIEPGESEVQVELSVRWAISG